MPKIWNPKTLAPPKGAYSQCAEIQAGERIVHLAGQIGVDTKGKLAVGIANKLNGLSRTYARRSEPTKWGLRTLPR